MMSVVAKATPATLPLTVGKRVIGVLYLNDKSQRQFSLAERSLITTPQPRG